LQYHWKFGQLFIKTYYDSQSALFNFNVVVTIIATATVTVTIKLYQKSQIMNFQCLGFLPLFNLIMDIQMDMRLAQLSISIDEGICLMALVSKSTDRKCQNS
jgi:hypothetical protein